MIGGGTWEGAPHVRHDGGGSSSALLGGAAARPIAARAQQAGRTYRLGILHNQGPQAPQFPPFYDELRRLGFAEGQNLIVDGRGYAARTEQFPAVAAELVKSQVDAILAGGAAASRVAQAATRTIPIFTLTDDMVGQGLAASLARPGANITGISILATELDGKRQEILMEMVPLARRIAVLADANTAASGNIQALREAARARGRGACRSFGRAAGADRTGDRGGEAFRLGSAQRAGLPDPLYAAPRHIRAHGCAALASDLPVTGVRRGGWIDRLWSAHHTDVPAAQRGKLAKVLAGENVSKVPIEQPTTFELAINLQAAKALGLEIPPSLLARADEVIE